MCLVLRFVEKSAVKAMTAAARDGLGFALALAAIFAAQPNAPTARDPHFDK